MVLFAPCVDDNLVLRLELLKTFLELHMHTGVCNCKVSPHHEYA